MGMIFNATNEEQSVKALGHWFTFKAKQIKNLQEHVSKFIDRERKDAGLVALPEAFEELDYRESPEGKAELARFEQQGIDAFVAFHRLVIHNNQVSLRRDLEQANIKSDPAAFASDGELASMRIVAQYQKMKDDTQQKRIEEVKRLVAQTGKA